MDEDIARCIACNELSDHCQGGHGEPCQDCQGWEGKHEWQVSLLGGTTTCKRCGLLPLDGDDTASPCPATGEHEARCPSVEDRPWVNVFFAQDESADEAYNEYDKDGQDGVYAAMDYMAQWDYGDETDGAHTHDPEDGDPWGSADTEVEAGRYLIFIGCQRRYISMYRRALHVKG